MEAALGKQVDPSPPEKTTKAAATTNYITTEKLLQIQKYFHGIDTDNSGTIEPEEMTAGLAKLSPDDPIYNLIMSSMEYMDVDSDGLIKYVAVPPTRTILTYCQLFGIS